MTEKRHKWDYPHEWFIEWIQEQAPTIVLREAIVLGRRLSADAIEDIYGNEMFADGYYEPLIDGKLLRNHDPYDLGWEAASEGLLCPYREGTWEWDDWQLGFTDRAGYEVYVEEALSGDITKSEMEGK